MNLNPLGGVNVQVEEVKGDLAPMQIAPEDKESMGLEDEVQEVATADPDQSEEEFVQTSEVKVRSMLKTLFFAGYVYNGEGHEHWLDNEKELDEIAPGMTAFVNQFPPLARAVEIGDTAAAPVKLLVVAAKKQIQSSRIKKKQVSAADPTEQTVAQGGTNLYAGIIDKS